MRARGKPLYRLLFTLLILSGILFGALRVGAEEDHTRKAVPNVRLTISRPVAGTTTDELPKVEVPFNANYGVYTTDGEPWETWSNENGSIFYYGGTFTLFVTLSADTEYYFQEGKAPEVTGGTLVEYSVSNDPGFSLMDVTVEMPATSHDLGNAKISGIKDKVYTGKPLTQNPVVKMLDDEVLERGRDYTVTLKSNKDVGYGTVLITGTGDYQNSLYLDFKILPKPTALNSLTAAKAGFTVNWKKQAAGTSGYQIQYSTSKSFAGSKTVTIGKTATVKRDIKKLKSKKNYYVRIRTFTQVGKSRFFSTWSDVKMVRTK